MKINNLKKRIQTLCGFLTLAFLAFFSIEPVRAETTYEVSCSDGETIVPTAHDCGVERNFEVIYCKMRRTHEDSCPGQVCDRKEGPKDITSPPIPLHQDTELWLQCRWDEDLNMYAWFIQCQTETTESLSCGDQNNDTCTWCDGSGKRHDDPFHHPTPTIDVAGYNDCNSRPIGPISKSAEALYEFFQDRAEERRVEIDALNKESLKSRLLNDVLAVDQGGSLGVSTPVCTMSPTRPKKEVDKLITGDQGTANPSPPVN